MLYINNCGVHLEDALPNQMSANTPRCPTEFKHRPLAHLTHAQSFSVRFCLQKTSTTPTTCCCAPRVNIPSAQRAKSRNRAHGCGVQGLIGSSNIWSFTMVRLSVVGARDETKNFNWQSQLVPINCFFFFEKQHVFLKRLEWNGQTLSKKFCFVFFYILEFQT